MKRPARLTVFGFLAILSLAQPAEAADKSVPHWAYKPLRRPPVPKVESPRIRNDIDRFILTSLANKNLAMAAEANRATLLRRIAFDLTGLPPTPEEINAFLSDLAPDASTRMVDRYLASPHYGERWGKYWLDAAGYADSNGYFNADSDRPLAYKYRDYVVRSFNLDMPFDQFVREQLAGDELAGYAPGGDVTPAMADKLIATHFLRNAPDGSGESDGNPDEVRIDRFTVIEGNLQIVMNTLLGVTIQCARCHTHKFEPIDHEEYYRLQAIFSPIYCPDRWVKPNERIVAIATRQQREDHQRRTERVDRQVQSLQSGLTTIAAPYRELVIEERLQSLAAPVREAVLAALRTLKEKLSGEQLMLLKKHVEPLKLTDDDVAKRFAEYHAVREHIRKAIAEREKERPPPLDRLGVAVEMDAAPPVHHLLVRGQHNKPGKAVEPGVPAAFTLMGNAFQVAAPAAGRGTGRRSAFARWVASPENPLFARVFVNRVWQHHFGRGLVTIPDNFGISGARPSHPELLDWLATEFIDKGWSVKHLHRIILESATYQQSSSVSLAKMQTAERIDADNRLLWRFPMRRLDAEALRDAMLSISGELDRRVGGPYVATQRTAEGNVEVDETRADARRRSLYLQQRRTQVATFLELFDAPAILSTCSARNTSTVPLQGLALLNSGFARQRAKAFAERLKNERREMRGEGREVGDARLSRAFLLACGKPAHDEERVAATRFLEKQRKLYAAEKDAELRAWTDLCQMVLASNAFLYVE